MKSYFRFLSRNKLYTLINIAGLVVSLMFIILMGDYTWRQYSIDSWHKNADRIYLTGSGEDFFMWPQAAQEINAMCPEIEQIGFFHLPTSHCHFDIISVVSIRKQDDYR